MPQYQDYLSKDILTANDLILILDTEDHTDSAAGTTKKTTVLAVVGAVGSHGEDIPSGATINLDTATGDYVHITGNTALSQIILADGKERTVRFTGTLTLIHDPAAINLPGNANITTAAGDLAIFRGDSGGKVRTVSYTKADGGALFELPGVEVTANKVVAISGASTDTEYPSAKLLYDQLALKLNGNQFTKANIGLGNADDTADAGKPVSAAQQAALDLKQNSLTAGANITIVGDVISAASGGGIDAATFNNQTASYTVTAADASTLANSYPIVTINNASANTLTIPPNSSVAIGVGEKIDFIQDGAGQTTITAGPGVTLLGTPGLKCRAQYSPVSIIKKSTDVWYVIGDLSA